MDNDKYLVPGREGHSNIREKMSRFIGFVFRVNDALEARARIKALANEYHDARHVCWAYMLGPERKEFLSNDNGEPSGTAGRPILGQINSAGLTDTLVCVVRYFGGIKLGTSGLTAAYKEAARLAIEDAGVEECTVMSQLTAVFPYDVTGEVMRIAKTPGVEIVGQEFGEECLLTLRCGASVLEALRGRLGSILTVRFLD